jgi:hypothetical protein
MLETLATPSVLAITLFLNAVSAKPSPKLGERLQAVSPSPFSGEGAGG